MRISNVIKKLQHYLDHHGDLNVYLTEDMLLKNFIIVNHYVLESDGSNVERKLILI